MTDLPLEFDPTVLDAEASARGVQARLFAEALKATAAARDRGVRLSLKSFLEEFTLGTSDVMGAGPSVTFSRDKDSIVREFRFVSPAALNGVAPRASWKSATAPRPEEIVDAAIDALGKEMEILAALPPKAEPKRGPRAFVS